MNAAKAAYCLGLRLKQLSISLPTTQGLDLSLARRYCGLATAAYETAKPLLDSTLVYRQGIDGLELIHRSLQFASNPEHEIQPDVSDKHTDIRTVMDVCRSRFENRGPELSTVEKWFRVGLQMASVEFEMNEESEDEHGKRTQNEAKYCNWIWENNPLLSDLLSDLGVSLDRLFPIDKDEEHHAERRREIASQMETPAGWIFLEIGLNSYWDVPPPSGKRSCYHRDHLFLEWFEAAGGSANARYKLIANRWNEEHTEKHVTLAVVKRGIIVAKDEV